MLFFHQPSKISRENLFKGFCWIMKWTDSFSRLPLKSIPIHFLSQILLLFLFFLFYYSVFVRHIKQQLWNLRLLLDVRTKVNDFQFYDTNIHFDHIKHHFWHNDIEICGVKAASSDRREYWKHTGQMPEYRCNSEFRQFIGTRYKHQHWIHTNRKVLRWNGQGNTAENLF